MGTFVSPSEPSCITLQVFGPSSWSLQVALLTSPVPSWFSLDASHSTASSLLYLLHLCPLLCVPGPSVPKRLCSSSPASSPCPPGASVCFFTPGVGSEWTAWPSQGSSLTAHLSLMALWSSHLPETWGSVPNMEESSRQSQGDPTTPPTSGSEALAFLLLFLPTSLLFFLPVSLCMHQGATP